MGERYVSVSIETWGEGSDPVDDDAIGELGSILQDMGAVGAVTSVGGIAGGPGATFGQNLDEDVDADAFRDVAGLQEVAEFLGVSKQRVAEPRVRPDFPAPVAELAAGPVWAVSSLNRFLAEWPRRPGRPRKRPEARRSVTPTRVLRRASHTRFPP